MLQIIIKPIKHVSSCKLDVHEVAEIKAELKVEGKSIVFVGDTAASVTVI